jgi:UDP-N-acetylglucosamine kinase
VSYNKQVTQDPRQLAEIAIQFAHSNKKTIAREIGNTETYPSEDRPVSIFMAGSPGAGKTEFSKELIQTLDGSTAPVRIDTDELRQRIPGYSGNNSYIFQPAASILVEKLHDHVLHVRQSFILDSTFSRTGKARLNIQRSLGRGRPVFIFYVYDDPIVAWKFTQAREMDEGRNIPKTAFIEEFFGAMDTVERMRKEFGNSITVFMVKKDLANPEGEKQFVVSLASPNSTIDNYVNRKYTREELSKIL